MTAQETTSSDEEQRHHSTLEWSFTHKLPRNSLLYVGILLTLSSAIIHGIAAAQALTQSAWIAVLLFSGAGIQAISAVGAAIWPARRVPLGAAVVQAVAVALWIAVRIFGVLGFAATGLVIWRPETLGLQDLFLPIAEGIAAGIFLRLAARTWITPSPAQRVALLALPVALGLALMAWIVLFAVNSYAAELVFATFFASAGLPLSLLTLVLPVVVALLLLFVLRPRVPQLSSLLPRGWRMVPSLVAAAFFACLLTWEGGSTAMIRAWLPVTDSVVSVSPGQTATLAYCHTGGNPLAMDLTEPAAGTARPAPVVLYIHGGAGFLNSRKLDADYDGAYFTAIRDGLVRHGFVVGAIDYPLVPLASAPEMVSDAKCAVRFLRAHGQSLGIDPLRIGVYGDSEGGYLASMLGTTATTHAYDTTEYKNQSSGVEAVGDLWGFTDLTDFSGSPNWVHPFGAGESTAQQLAESPVAYVAPGDPPFLIIHGAADNLIAPHHSTGLAHRLQAAGVPTQLVMVQHGGHGFATPTAGMKQDPAPDALVSLITDFFVKTLAV